LGGKRKKKEKKGGGKIGGAPTNIKAFPVASGRPQKEREKGQRKKRKRREKCPEVTPKSIPTYQLAQKGERKRFGKKKGKRKKFTRTTLVAGFFGIDG